MECQQRRLKIKYAILIPYYNRLEQLKNTLISFDHHYSKRNDWIAIVVVGQKESEIVGKIKEFGFKNCLTILSPVLSNTPVVEYNYAAKISEAEYFVLTNPECLHRVDILSICDEIFSKSDPYIMCACEAIDNMTGKFPNIEYTHEMWYQHSIHRNRKLNFCSVISSANYNKIGGFNEEYINGIGCADDEFLDNVIENYIPIVVRDDALVLHQKHPPQPNLAEGIQLSHYIYEKNKRKKQKWN